MSSMMMELIQEEDTMSTEYKKPKMPNLPPGYRWKIKSTGTDWFLLVELQKRFLGVFWVQRDFEEVWFWPCAHPNTYEIRKMSKLISETAEEIWDRNFGSSEWTSVGELFKGTYPPNNLPTREKGTDQ